MTVRALWPKERVSLDTSKPIAVCRLRARSQQRFDALNVALKAGFVEGRIAIPVFGLYLRTLLQQ